MCGFPFFLFRISVLIAPLLLAACSTWLPYSQVTKLDLTLTASDQLNPDLNGRPSPVVIRLIELKHPVAFENADFFSLYERARETLMPDLVTVEEHELRPGQRLDLKLSVDNNHRFVGVLAAYRDLSESRWRHVVQVEPMGVTQVHLLLDQKGIHNSNQPDDQP